MPLTWLTQEHWDLEAPLPRAGRPSLSLREAALCPCGGRPLPKGVRCYFCLMSTPSDQSVRVNGCGAFADLLNGALGRHSSCRHDIIKGPRALSPVILRASLLLGATAQSRPRGQGGPVAWLEKAELAPTQAEFHLLHVDVPASARRWAPGTP